ncbi:cellulose synthase-like protein G2 [Pyrus ussuriensis x Pyrus communis]|uniref:Cellulose synthase-like protein G2 n=1 Tax=Pyrus ussuriensis x Pyrus communis TaxID=2448454 RepID=A0A5N5HX31_9ROSA|nr:cellulose synthase-like protein G2 [Pyrus ussuriensis x Pyrus communis]
MENSKVPLHLCHVHKLSNFINRTHILVHSIALVFLISYRASFFFQHPKTKATTLPWLLVFASEVLLAFEWLLSQSFRWRTVSRTVFPERLPEDDKLPPIDVFICTADPEKEPTVGVMNTVLSAMAMDYPPEKLHVYLSDDAGAAVTLNGMREAWRYGIKCTAPEAYFSAGEDDGDENGGFGGSEFVQEKEHIKEKYEAFKKSVTENARIGDTRCNSRRDHSAVIEVIQETSSDNADAIQANEAKNKPLLIYVSREKRPSQPHHFKAGALNVLLRESAVISNSPYILGLDCDMHCHDASSARQAMCFHLDPKISHSLAFVQFPQNFCNISNNDIYDSQLRSAFKVLWKGYDGLGGPCVCGTGYYIKRVSLCESSISEAGDAMKLRQCFGPSNEFIKSLRQINKPDRMFVQRNNAQPNETQLLASCAYEDGTKWGKEVGFLYGSVVEDYFTGFHLHCKGWISVYCDPKRPQFLGSGTTNLDDFLVQGTRWSSGLVDVAISKFNPLIYGPFKMPTFLHSMCYAELALFPIFYFLSLWGFATIPQLCLLNGIPLYPQVSNTYFIVFSFIFLSSHSKHLYEVLATGSTFRHWVNEQRIWMMKSVTSHLYGSVDAFMKKLGMREASFFPTNKVDDVEQLKRYNMGVFDFQTSRLFLVPMVALVILNMASFVVGIARGIFVGELDKMKDKGSIPLSVTLVSALVSLIFYFFGSIIFM